MELEGNALSKKAQVLKNRLYQRTGYLGSPAGFLVKHTICIISPISSSCWTFLLGG